MKKVIAQAGDSITVLSRNDEKILLLYNDSYLILSIEEFELSFCFPLTVVALMLHGYYPTSFKVSKVLAPTVVLLEEIKYSPFNLN